MENKLGYVLHVCCFLFCVFCISFNIFTGQEPRDEKSCVVTFTQLDESGAIVTVARRTIWTACKVLVCSAYIFKKITSHL